VRLDFQKEQVMSNNQFIEALSADAYVRAVSRRAVRLLNDPTLDRQQREHHIRQLQSLLVAHQAKEAVKARKLADKKEKREQVARGKDGVADQSQVVARRREFSHLNRVGTDPVTDVKAQPVLASNVIHVPLRHRGVLKLKKA
jgi:hypothetical protein